FISSSPSDLLVCFDADPDSHPSSSSDSVAGGAGGQQATTPSLCLPSTFPFSFSFSLSPRHCWVCFATEGDDRSAEWVCPCRCKGSTKWIHQACLQRWLDEKQKGNSIGSVSCPQCGTEYCIVFPKVGPVVYFLQQVDRILSKVSPFAAAGIVVGTLYWSAVTYGAVTVMQVRCNVAAGETALPPKQEWDPTLVATGLEGDR
ncbi:E3 ubiquitin-protein ligase MARCH5-like, partial [Notechis scutatus]|uniref:E3 ubiquitin-protein ligase MARCHF5 n=1 Tax=Notechis scutatus TaxID=8663 RepID=A0A6J1W1X9_9SAUR